MAGGRKPTPRKSGWALGDGQEHGDDPAWDAVEAEALYDLLEREVIPEFYTRDEKGIPTAWVARMRESMAQLTPRFSANRTVREYTEQHYLPAAAAYRERAADKGAVGRNIINWEHTLTEKWATLRFGDVKIQTNAAQHIITAEVYLNDLDPNAVRVELYANGINGSSPIRQEMTRVQLPTVRSGRVHLPRIGPGGPSGQRTIRRALYLAVPALGCPWKSLRFSGSGEWTLNGQETVHAACEQFYATLSHKVSNHPSSDGGRWRYAGACGGRLRGRGARLHRRSVLDSIQIGEVSRAVRARTSRSFGINLFAPIPAPIEAGELRLALETVAPFTRSLAYQLPHLRRFRRHNMFHLTNSSPQLSRAVRRRSASRLESCRRTQSMQSKHVECS